MGNDASRFGRRCQVKEKAREICTRKPSQESSRAVIEGCGQSDVTTAVAPLYKKKAHRLSSANRFSSVSQSSEKKRAEKAAAAANTHHQTSSQAPTPSSPVPILRATTSSPNMKDYRRTSITHSNTNLNSPPSSNGSLTTSSSLLVPGRDRRRSRSLCQTSMQADVQELASKANAASDKVNGSTSRKNSTAGLVPQLNRLRIQQCYKAAKNSIGESILKRSSQSRSDFRAFMNNLDDEQTGHLAEQTYKLITDAVENVERPEKVLSHAARYGESFVSLCPLGFRPDLFSVLADACIAECVKLDGGTHKRCETLIAWSQLFAAIFSPVRDGYYQRIRYQRRASLPQYAVARQASIENSNPNSRTSSSRGSQEKDD